MPALAVAHGRPAHLRALAAARHGPAGELPRDGPEVQRQRHAHRRRHGARASAASVTRVGKLSTKIAPGAKARLVVRLSKKGAALIRKRSAVTIAARVSIRAGTAAVVRRPACACCCTAAVT